MVREKYLEWDYEWKNEIERLYNMQMTWLKKAVDWWRMMNEENNDMTCYEYLPFSNIIHFIYILHTQILKIS